MSKIHEKPSFDLIPKIKLSSLQIEGVRFLLSRRGGILNYGTGVGKTFTALHAAINLMDFYEDVKTVVFCPVGASRAWKKELKTLGQHFAFFSSEGVECAGSVEKAKIWIVNFTAMEKFEEQIVKRLKEFKCVGCIDEAHLLANPQTRQSRSLKFYRRYFYLTWLLTATPLMGLSNIKGLFHLADFVLPGALSSWTDFKSNYLIWKWNIIRGAGGKMVRTEEILGIKNVEILKEKLSLLMKVGTVEYPVKYHYYDTHLIEDEMVYYRQAGQGVLKDFEKKHFASRLHDLQRIVDWSHESLTEAQKKQVSSKEKLLIKVLKEQVLDKGEAALIYTDYHSTADRLTLLLESAKAKGVIDYRSLYKITGKESKKERDAVEDKIAPRTVTILSKAGSTSRNLQKSNHIIFYNLSFSLGTHLQTCGRITRVDSKHDTMHFHLLSALGTIDEYKKRYLSESSSIISELFGDNTNLPKDVESLDRNFIADLRRKLLWGFRQKKVMSLDELAALTKEEMEKSETIPGVSEVKSGDFA